MRNDSLIHAHLQVSLSSLQVTKAQQQDMMLNIIGGKKMKKKSTFALVCIITLVLMTVSVVALTITQLVQQSFDEALQQEDETGFLSRWNEDDKEAYAQMLLDKGLIHASDVPVLIADWAYVDDAIVFTAELANGQYHNWTIEQKAWLDDILFSCSVRDFPIHILPDPQAIQQDTALQMTIDHIAEWSSITKEELSTYQTQISYTDFRDGRGPYWTIQFYEQDAQQSPPRYIATLYEVDGFVTYQERYPDATTAELHFYDLIDKRGPFRYWTIEEKYAYMQELAAYCEQESAQGGFIPDVLIQIQNHKHGLPAPDGLTESEVVLMTTEHLQNEGQINIDLSLCDVAVSYYVDDPNAPLWQVDYYQIVKKYSVQISAIDQTIQTIYNKDTGLDLYAKAASEADLYEETLRSRESNDKLWTLEEQAQLHALQLEAGAILRLRSVLPIEGEITQEQACTIAKNALLAQSIDPNNYLIATHFYLRESTGKREWFFEFYGNDQDPVFVTVDSMDDTVVKLWQDSNG